MLIDGTQYSFFLGRQIVFQSFAVDQQHSNLRTRDNIIVDDPHAATPYLAPAFSIALFADHRCP